jgi:large subunit ribosomal protein L24
MTTIKARKQRSTLYNAPIHLKRKWISSHLAENLLLKYDRRSIPVIKGDTVKVMRGSYKGHEDKVAKVNVRDMTVNVEGVIVSTAKGTKVAKPIHANTLVITKLNLTDKWRRAKLEAKLSDAAKKEVEKEAEEQLKAQEEERKAAEKAKEDAERAAKAAEEAEKEAAEAPAEPELPAAPEEKAPELPAEEQKPKAHAPEHKPKAQPAEKTEAEKAPAKKPAPKKPKTEEGEP